MAGQAKDEVHSHFTTKDEKYEVEGCVKTHKVCACDHVKVLYTSAWSTLTEEPTVFIHTYRPSNKKLREKNLATFNLDF